MSNLPAVVAVAVVAVVVAVVLIRKRGNRAARADAPLLVPQTPAASRLRGRLGRLLNAAALDDAFWSSLEEALIEADVGLDVTAKLLGAARAGHSADEVREILTQEMTALFPRPAGLAGASPCVIVVLGVNGVGKTTTIAKLARMFSAGGRRVLLVAADTFRAAAVDQLKTWGQRLSLEVVAQAPGADAAAVAFDGVSKAVARGHDIVLIDTAGRLHTKAGLMEELGKVGRVAGKALPGAPHERWLVIDATVGANGLAQAREFHRAIGLTGVIVAKLDGTAKGGVVLAIAGELGVPITHVGVGEGMEDLRPFDPDVFVASLVGHPERGEG